MCAARDKDTLSKPQFFGLLCILAWLFIALFGESSAKNHQNLKNKEAFPYVERALSARP